MARTKGDFLNDARTRAAIQRPVFEIVPTNDSDDYAGNEIVGRRVLEADASYDGPASVTGGSSEFSYGTNQTTPWAEQGTDGRINELDFSRNGIDAIYGGNDDQTRDSYTGAYQPVQRPTEPVPVKTVKARSSFLDNAIGKVSRATSKPTKAKVDTINKVAGVTRKLLTLQEIANNKPILIKLILWSSDNIDHGFEAITKGHRPVEIWSNLEFSDVEILVDAILEMGQKSEKAATAVRQIMEYEKKGQLLVILAPRIAKSIMHLFANGIDLRMVL